MAAFYTQAGMLLLKSARLTAGNCRKAVQFKVGHVRKSRLVNFRREAPGIWHKLVLKICAPHIRDLKQFRQHKIANP